MKITLHPSPNHNSRDNHVIDMLVLHYTGMQTAEGALDKLCNAESKVSSHYFIHEDGRIVNLVPEEMRAWHAGTSHWRGANNINQRSIGIEIVNPGHEYGYRPFPPVQMQAVAWLTHTILARHAIPARNVVGHSDIAPVRKEDPGELFDWHFLATQGAGLWPAHGELPPAKAEQLAEYGYDTSNMEKAITAFQRHFRPKIISPQWDNECATLLAALLRMI